MDATNAGINSAPIRTVQDGEFKQEGSVVARGSTVFSSLSGIDTFSWGCRHVCDRINFPCGGDAARIHSSADRGPQKTPTSTPTFTATYSATTTSTLTATRTPARPPNLPAIPKKPHASQKSHLYSRRPQQPVEITRP